MFHLSPFGDLWNQLVKKTSPKNFMWATKTYTVKKHVFHLLQSCFKPGRLYCWMDKMLRKLGCFTVKEWNSCGIYLISTNLTYFVHLKSSSRNTSGSMLFASQLNFFFETPKNLADWLTIVFSAGSRQPRRQKLFDPQRRIRVLPREGEGWPAMGGRHDHPQRRQGRRFR